MVTRIHSMNQIVKLIGHFLLLAKYILVFKILRIWCWLIIDEIFIYSIITTVKDTNWSFMESVLKWQLRFEKTDWIVILVVIGADNVLDWIVLSNDWGSWFYGLCCHVSDLFRCILLLRILVKFWGFFLKYIIEDFNTFSCQAQLIIKTEMICRGLNHLSLIELLCVFAIIKFINQILPLRFTVLYLLGFFRLLDWFYRFSLPRALSNCHIWLFW